MDIHKPKPWHGWREFLKEYLIIVVGVLTALAAEQAVEWVHRQEAVGEARRALNEEAGSNIAVFRAMAEQDACIQKRLDELERWRAAKVDGKPLHLTGEIAHPMGINLRTSVWRVTAAAAATQMPYEDRVRYARLYDAFDNNNTIRRERGEAWAEISPYLRAKRLSDDQLIRLDSVLERARATSESLHRNWANVSRFAKDAGVTPVDAARAQSLARESAASLCRPMLRPVSPAHSR